MFRLEASAVAELEPDSLAAAESFLSALPPQLSRQVARVRLFGSHARRFEPDAAFELLLEVDKSTVEVKTGVSIATDVVEAQSLVTAAVTVVTAFEAQNASGLLSRTLRNAEREGLDLWVRPGRGA